MQNLGHGGQNKKFQNLGGQWYEGVKAVYMNSQKSWGGAILGGNPAITNLLQHYQFAQIDTIATKFTILEFINYIANHPSLITLQYTHGEYSLHEPISKS